MYKSLLKSMLAVAILAAGSISVQAKNWKIDFTALGAKYVDKTGVTISEAVTANVGTCSIVEGTLQNAIEVEGGDPITKDSEELNQNFTLQTGTTWMVRPGGLYSSNGGGRKLALLNCEAGQTIKMAISIAPTLDATDVAVFDEDASAEGVYIYKVNTSGDVFFTITRYSYITSIAVENTEWEIDFLGLGAKYVDKTGVTISDAVTSNVGTCSIVNGTLQNAIEVEEGDPITTDSEELDERFTLQTGTSWLIRSGGLYSANGGGRVLGILDARKDQTITIVISIVPTLNGTNAELKSSADNEYVYTVKEDGNVFFSITRYSYISKIAVADVKGVDYTVKFVNEAGETVKEDAVHKGEPGSPVELTASDKASFYTEDGSIKYIFKESNAAEVTVAADGSTVVTVVFREAEIYAGVLNCMITGVEGLSGSAARLAQFQGFTFFEGDNYYVYPSRGYGKEGKYYFTEATSWNGVTFTFPPANQNPRPINGVKTFIGQQNYVAVDSVAYYSDFERLALPVEDEGNGTGLGQLVGTVNSWYSFSGGIFDRFSQGRGIRLDADSYVYTEPIAEAGTYKITVYGRNDQGVQNETPYKLGYILDGESYIYNDVTVPAWGSAVTGTNVVEGVAIPAGANLMVMYGGGLVSLDDISLTKTGDYVAPVVTAINTIVENVQPATNAIFNLAGQQVRTTQRGLYIINGRKVVK